MSEFIAYFRTRIATPRIALLWVVVVAAWFAGVAIIETARIGLTAALLALLIAQFRLWDDLEDVGHDRRHHGERVLVRAVNLLPFRIALVVSLVAGLVAIALSNGVEQGIVYAALVAGFALFYVYLRRGSASRLLRTQFVLLKYPVFVLMFAPDPSYWRAPAAAVVLYCLLSAYDSRDGGAR